MVVTGFYFHCARSDMFRGQIRLVLPPIFGGVCVCVFSFQLYQPDSVKVTQLPSVLWPLLSQPRRVCEKTQSARAAQSFKTQGCGRAKGVIH